ncbi:WRKY DNA-binding protein 32 [Euphorbia peplus]|nr:WRKY DNA-binding protein 32 [Euphorbia peplus]
MDETELQVPLEVQGEDKKGNSQEEQEEDEEASEISELNQLTRLTESQFEPSASTALSPENDQCVGLQDTSSLEKGEQTKFKEQDAVSNPEASKAATTLDAESLAQNQLQSSQYATSLLEFSPTSVTQLISSAPSPTLPELTISPSKTNNAHTPEADLQKSSSFKSLSASVVRTHTPDGYNWRKYGQKQVKSPTGSRSYYRCTYSDCSAKKIECADHSGNIIQIVNKGNHSHDPLWKNNSARENRVALSSQPVMQNSGIEHSISKSKDSEQATLKESTKEASPVPDKKRQNSSGPDGNGIMQIKDEHASEPEPKRRVKKENLESAGTPIKPGKKPKFIVHAAGDVGISGDGYRWRKYGQKMVKGNPYPRNYYRCTSAGCPVRKHIETAVDNSNAVIITYKGVHDHDTPVPKKRHGPPSAPLVAAAAPASMNTIQVKKIDTPKNQVMSTQWSVGKEGELTSETLDVGADKEKAIESARTLLSIGFEIKPC